MCNGAFPPFNSSSTLANCFQISIRITRIPCLPCTSWQALETCTVAINCLCQANCLENFWGSYRLLKILWTNRKVLTFKYTRKPCKFCKDNTYFLSIRTTKRCWRMYRQLHASIHWPVFFVNYSIWHSPGAN